MKTRTKSKKTKKTNIQHSSKISPRLQEEFARFLEYHPAKRLSMNLRKCFLEFLMYDGSVEAEYLKDLVNDLDGLFDLLDVAQEEASLAHSPN